VLRVQHEWHHDKKRRGKKRMGKEGMMDKQKPVGCASCEENTLASELDPGAKLPEGSTKS
jgi:hypothetical protein